MHSGSTETASENNVLLIQTINSTTSIAPTTTSFFYPGSLFTPRKTKPVEEITIDRSEKPKVLNISTYLAILNNLLERYQSFPAADQDYIAAIKHDMNHFDIHPNPTLAFEAHIRMLQDELKNSQNMQNQLTI